MLYISTRMQIGAAAVGKTLPSEQLEEGFGLSEEDGASSPIASYISCDSAFASRSKRI